MPDTQDTRSPGFDLRAVNQTVIAEYRATGGALVKTLPGSRLVLLTTTGRRTGKDHTTPLGYVTDTGDREDQEDPATPSATTGPADLAHPTGGRPDRIIVFASNMAAPRDPDWYRNLTANPKVVVELGTDRFEAEAVSAVDTERARLHEALVAAMPGLRDHQDRVDREIPVVVLSPLR
ncbi:nitroreductase/quinone reductase family protein [Frankia sp. AgB32]|uniref:nitroreductase/quinone reductase family protein n=1 Tax=Frankia sp. AgB32 TaxID=631119 RepID=UPI00201040B0|nr:nitroreductase/quinone reductase family protein [Frankia sp. AgB32]MCK9893864.1 nitroreductase family deazaflavin-dependent oxidoreductase [Frankia sp. AgB32]